MTHVLLVCTGNICRSPLAEALLRRELQSAKAADIVVSSAGTGAWDGAPGSEGAYLIALEHELDLSEHRARLLTREVVEEAHLVLTMARHHRARVEELGGRGRVHVLGEYVGLSGPDAEVKDPFGGDLDVYRETYEELESLMRRAAERVMKEHSERSQSDH